ncbi:hypothetical protein C1633_26020 [Pseudomonas protegens]|nr:hypothetical protein C1633_26020 [Pseudomonas protegens]
MAGGRRGRGIAFAGKPAPTVAGAAYCLVGAGLPAKGPVRSPSLASQLLQLVLQYLVQHRAIDAQGRSVEHAF